MYGPSNHWRLIGRDVFDSSVQWYYLSKYIGVITFTDPSSVFTLLSLNNQPNDEQI